MVRPVGRSIDCHQHFWTADPALHPWLPRDDPILFRDYGPDMLRPQMEASGVAATIVVQASPNDADTDALIGIAARHDWIAGVVGWVDPRSPELEDRLHRLAATPKFCGIRPGIRRPAPEQWQPAADDHRLFDLAGRYHLSVDLLVRGHQLDAIDAVAAEHGDLAMILDHAGGPPVGDGFAAWQRGIERLARHPRLGCKFSGLLTAAPRADAAFAERVARVLLGSFGPGRLAWGSDWPILCQTTSYQDWHDMAAGIVTNIAGQDAARSVMGDTAASFYRLRPAPVDDQPLTSLTSHDSRSTRHE